MGFFVLDPALKPIAPDHTKETVLIWNLSKAACRRWIKWKVGIEELVHWTTPYLAERREQDRALLLEWQKIVADCSNQWGRMVGSESLINSAEEIRQSDEPEEDTLIDEVAATLDEL